jgi:hypothetical protein
MSTVTALEARTDFPFVLLRLIFWFALVLSADGEDSSRFLQPVSLTGSISTSSNSPALFTFRRSAGLEGSKVFASRDYLAPDGTLAAKESVEYDGNKLNRFVLEELQIQARGSATFERTAAGKTFIRFEYETGAKRKKTATETQSGAVLVNDTLPDFIMQNWDGLLSGQSFVFRYAIIPRLETIAFMLRKTGERETQKGRVAEIEMRPANWVLQKMVESIVFSVELQAPHRILQYTGRTTPKLRHGHTWDDLDAVTTFNW